MNLGLRPARQKEELLHLLKNVQQHFKNTMGLEASREILISALEERSKECARQVLSNMLSQLNGEECLKFIDLLSEKQPSSKEQSQTSQLQGNNGAADPGASATNISSDKPGKVIRQKPRQGS